MMLWTRRRPLLLQHPSALVRMIMWPLLTLSLFTSLLTILFLGHLRLRLIGGAKNEASEGTQAAPLFAHHILRFPSWHWMAQQHMGTLFWRTFACNTSSSLTIARLENRDHHTSLESLFTVDSVWSIDGTALTTEVEHRNFIFEMEAGWPTARRSDAIAFLVTPARSSAINVQATFLDFDPVLELMQFESPPSVVEWTDRALMSWMGSHNEEWRTDVVDQLQALINITRIGKGWEHQMTDFVECFGADTVPDFRGREIKQCVSRKFKFNLVIEDTVQEDLVTDKFFDSLFSDSVTVYLGAPNVLRDYAPSASSFINVAAFPTHQALVDHLEAVASDERVWRSFFKWRADPAAVAKLSGVWHHSFQHIGCNVAAFLQHHAPAVS